MEWLTRREVPEHHSSFIEVKAGMDEKLPLVLIIMVVAVVVVVVVLVLVTAVVIAVIQKWLKDNLLM